MILTSPEREIFSNNNEHYYYYYDKTRQKKKEAGERALPSTKKPRVSETIDK